jgi:tetratricopeptide (TPR) repeat protein
LASLALWLGNSLGGALGIHLLAWSAHLGATWFAFRIGEATLRDGGRALLVALLFGLHPVQVEAVAWCSAINDPLFWCCGLASLDAALRGRDGRAAVMLLLALLAKENAVSLLPVVACASWRAPEGRFPRLATLGAGAVRWWLLRAVVLGDVAGGVDRASVDPVIASKWARGALELFGRELELLVWPWPQSPFRPLTFDSATLLRAAAWTGAWLLGFVLAWRTRRRAIASWLLLVGAQPILCALFCDRLGAYPVADRYLGPSVLGAAMLVLSVPRRFAMAAAAAIAATAAVATLRYTPVFRGPDNLVQHGLAVAPDDPLLHCMAGNIALERSRVPEAAAHFAAALEDLPAGEAGAQHHAVVDARVGLGWCALASSPPALERAHDHFTRAIGIDPESVAAWIGLGVARGMAGQPGPAEQALRRALELAPASSRAHYNLAFLLARTGRRAEARTSAEEALRCDPGNTQARALLDDLR